MYSEAVSRQKIYFRNSSPKMCMSSSHTNLPARARSRHPNVLAGHTTQKRGNEVAWSSGAAEHRSDAQQSDLDSETREEVSQQTKHKATETSDADDNSFGRQGVWQMFRIFESIVESWNSYPSANENKHHHSLPRGPGPTVVHQVERGRRAKPKSNQDRTSTQARKSAT